MGFSGVSHLALLLVLVVFHNCQACLCPKQESMPAIQTFCPFGLRLRGLLVLPDK